MIARSRFLFVFLLAPLLACAGSKDGAAKGDAPSKADAAAKSDAPAREEESDAAKGRRLVEQEGALLVDVRTDAEFGSGHIDGAMHIPHDQIGDRVAEVEKAVGGDKAKPVVVYCRSGRRSGMAKQTLESKGFTNVVNLGGIDDWGPR